LQRVKGRRQPNTATGGEACLPVGRWAPCKSGKSFKHDIAVWRFPMISSNPRVGSWKSATVHVLSMEISTRAPTYRLHVRAP
jgi:hypothetical protein